MGTYPNPSSFEQQELLGTRMEKLGEFHAFLSPREIKANPQGSKTSRCMKNYKEEFEDNVNLSKEKSNNLKIIKRSPPQFKILVSLKMRSYFGEGLPHSIYCPHHVVFHLLFCEQTGSINLFQSSVMKFKNVS